MKNRTCLICDKGISHRHKNVKLCGSRECYNANKRRRARLERRLSTATCAICGMEFTQVNGNQKYCAPDCAYVAKNSMPDADPRFRIRADDWTQKKYEV